MSSSVSTYHCLCTQLLLATNTSSLSNLPTRQCDNSTIVLLSPSQEDMTPDTSILTKSATFSDTPLILHLEDGFEKRYPVTCERCGLMLGYQLDVSQWEGTKDERGRRKDVVYVLKGGVMGTEDVKMGRKSSEREIQVKVG